VPSILGILQAWPDNDICCAAAYGFSYPNAVCHTNRNANGNNDPQPHLNSHCHANRDPNGNHDT
jgi:hypothetical protein